MKANSCEAVLHLHRTFRPRRRTGRGFLTGTVFLDAALLFTAFVLSTSSFVLKPGITIELPPSTAQVDGIRPNQMILRISDNGRYFFNDELLSLDRLEAALKAAVLKQDDITLILEADQSLSNTDTATLYEIASRAGIPRIFIATRPTQAQ